MNLKLNSKRLEHVKSGESVFDALTHLGGKASSAEIVKRIANSISQPEHIIQPEVKQVLRSAVVNGYLIRHGKNYVLSRSCRTLYTDSGNRRINSSACGKKKGEKPSSFRTFGFPLWWQRFWNRFVVSKNSNDESGSEQCTVQTPLNGTEPLSSVDVSDLAPGLEREAEPSTPDIPKNIISVAESSVTQDQSEETCSPISFNETEGNEPESISEVSIEEPAGSNPNELKISISLHSIESVNDSISSWIDDDLKQDIGMD